MKKIHVIYIFLVLFLVVAPSVLSMPAEFKTNNETNKYNPNIESNELYNLTFLILEWFPESIEHSIVEIKYYHHPEEKEALTIFGLWFIQLEICRFSYILEGSYVTYEIDKPGHYLVRGDLIMDHDIVKPILI